MIPRRLNNRNPHVTDYFVRIIAMICLALFVVSQMAACSKEAEICILSETHESGGNTYLIEVWNTEKRVIPSAEMPNGGTNITYLMLLETKHQLFGTFELRVSSSDGVVINTLQLNSLFDGKDMWSMDIYTDSKQISYWQDYNGDGQDDFAIGLANSFLILTLDPNGIVSLLPIEGRYIRSVDTSGGDCWQYRLPIYMSADKCVGVISTRWEAEPYSHLVDELYCWDGSKFVNSGIYDMQK